MVPTKDDPTAKEPAGHRGSGRVDPVRVVVQAALAVYLIPVVLVVCLIGVASIAIGASARLAGRLVPRRGVGRATGPRLADVGRGSRVVH